MTKEVISRNGGLQIARAVACLCVLLSHALYRVGVTHNSPAPNWLTGNGGQFGISLFFVLSGYLMGRIVIEKKQTASTLSADISFILDSSSFFLYFQPFAWPYFTTTGCYNFLVVTNKQRWVFIWYSCVDADV